MKLINFSDFASVFWRKEKQYSSVVNENKKTDKIWTGCFTQPFKMTIFFFSIGLFVRKIFILFASSFTVQFFAF